jgi:hypothetical protein
MKEVSLERGPAPTFNPQSPLIFMAKKESTKNLLVQAARQKAAEQAEGKNKGGILGRDLSGQFSSGRAANQAQRPTKRGGRNGQGKP